MTLLLIFGYLAFTAVMLFLMISPFLGGKRASTRAEHLDDEVRELEQLLARRQMLLSSLRELEFEHATGKSAQSDYETFKRRYERETVAIMRRLDELHGGRGWESKIDAELEARLGKKPRHAGSQQEDEVAIEATPPVQAPAQEEVVAIVMTDEETATPDASSSCPACGNEIEPDDVFCSRCGTRVDAASAVSDDAPSAKQEATP